MLLKSKLGIIYHLSVSNCSLILKYCDDILLVFVCTNCNNFSQVNIRSIDEAVVIGAALSLSSSAFVLQVSKLLISINDFVDPPISFSQIAIQCIMRFPGTVLDRALWSLSCMMYVQLLAEKGELPTRFGSATLGILLLQVIFIAFASAILYKISIISFGGLSYDINNPFGLVLLDMCRTQRSSLSQSYCQCQRAR